MSFLAPLFLIGLASLALPIVLHLRAKKPKQTVAFSSLMFFEEKPPMTRKRTQVQDIFLLILRCLALALLVLAFARPFFPAEANLETADAAEMHYILIDTSASMRDEAMIQAKEMAQKLITDLPSKDWIALATYSDRLEPLITLEAAQRTIPSERGSTVLTALASVKAGWHASRLDTVLQAAAIGTDEAFQLNIHVISDLQRQRGLEGLEEAFWPETVRIIPHPVVPELGWTNAGVRVMPVVDGQQRVRITNAAGSQESDFTLSWEGQEPLQIAVPPGESAFFEAPESLLAEGTIRLIGDDFAYDNAAAWVTPILPAAFVYYPLSVRVDDPEEEAYYVNRALQPTKDYTVEISQLASDEPAALTLTRGETDVRPILASGGNVLFTLSDLDSARALGDLLEMDSEGVAEAVIESHALFGEIDFKSNPFALFADARYADFSSIRIWKYRALPESWASGGRVLARFDSGDPAWLRYDVGGGALHVLTTTWRPEDSQLALSTKFPPLLHGVLAEGFKQDQRLPLSIVGEAYDEPGIYREDGFAFSVQLDPGETERTPLQEADLRALGLPLDEPTVQTYSAASIQNLTSAELESRQRIGWWFLLAAAAFFLAETGFASLTRKSQTLAAQ
ncbi:MAG: BatA domain-containing protein [Verrucomicrobiota bacterium]